MFWCCCSCLLVWLELGRARDNPIVCVYDVRAVNRKEEQDAATANGSALEGGMDDEQVVSDTGDRCNGSSFECPSCERPDKSVHVVFQG